MNVLTAGEEQRRLQLYRSGKTDQEIADTLFIHKTSVRRWRALHGLTPNGKKGNYVHIDYDMADKMLLSGKTVSEVADLLGCCKHSIYNYIRRKRNENR